MSFFSSRSWLPIVLLAAAVPAQQLTLRGELDEGRSTGCYYCPNVPYTIKFSETPVRSSSGVDLAAYKALGEQLELIGTWDTSTNPAGLDVSAVNVVSQSLSVSNTAATGAKLRFTTSGAPGSLAATAIAFGNGFLPLFGSTAMLLDPASIVVLGANTLDVSGTWRFNLAVPANPGLVGVRFWSQSLLLPTNGTPYSSNPRVTLVDR